MARLLAGAAGGLILLAIIGVAGALLAGNDLAAILHGRFNQCSIPRSAHLPFVREDVEFRQNLLTGPPGRKICTQFVRVSAHRRLASSSVDVNLTVVRNGDGITFQTVSFPGPYEVLSNGDIRFTDPYPGEITYHFKIQDSSGQWHWNSIPDDSVYGAVVLDCNSYAPVPSTNRRWPDQRRPTEPNRTLIKAQSFNACMEYAVTVLDVDENEHTVDPRIINHP